MRPQLPPEPRVIGTSAAVASSEASSQKSSKSRSARGPGARPAADRDLPRRRQTGVTAVTKGRVRRQCLQQRQVLAQHVERADRRRRVGHADMHMQSGDRRDDRIAEQVLNPLVALLVGDLRVALGRGGWVPEPSSPAPISRTARRIEASEPIASPTVWCTSVINSSWQACSSWATEPVSSPSALDHGRGRVHWRPVTGSTGNNSSSTPSENGRPEPKQTSGSASSVSSLTLHPTLPGSRRRQQVVKRLAFRRRASTIARMNATVHERERLADPAWRQWGPTFPSAPGALSGRTTVPMATPGRRFLMTTRVRGPIAGVRTASAGSVTRSSCSAWPSRCGTGTIRSSRNGFSD